VLIVETKISVSAVSSLGIVKSVVSGGSFGLLLETSAAFVVWSVPSEFGKSFVEKVEKTVIMDGFEVAIEAVESIFGVPVASLDSPGTVFASDVWEIADTVGFERSVESDTSGEKLASEDSLSVKVTKVSEDPVSVSVTKVSEAVISDWKVDGFSEFVASEIPVKSVEPLESLLENEGFVESVTFKV
jgi:hypothetical protein